MQLVEAQEQILRIRPVQLVIAAEPRHQMVVPARLVQSPPVHQLQTVVLAAAARVGRQALMWSAEAALTEL
jgi:hypothetical protein